MLPSVTFSVMPGGSHHSACHHCGDCSVLTTLTRLTVHHVTAQHGGLGLVRVNNRFVTTRFYRAWFQTSVCIISAKLTNCLSFPFKYLTRKIKKRVVVWKSQLRPSRLTRIFIERIDVLLNRTCHEGTKTTSFKIHSLNHLWQVILKLHRLVLRRLREEHWKPLIFTRDINFNIHVCLFCIIC